jgi:hypothetical protein
VQAIDFRAQVEPDCPERLLFLNKRVGVVCGWCSRFLSG